MKHILLGLFLWLAIPNVLFAETVPLPADQAFQFTATARDYQTILLLWKIAPDYYLYQEHFSFRILSPANTVLGNPIYPANTQTLKTSLGMFQVYANAVTIPIPIIQSDQKSLVLQVNYQGCSKAGYCYPPTTKVVPINLAANFMQPVSGLAIDVPSAPITTPTDLTGTHQDGVSELLKHHSFFLMMLGFLGFGVLLSLTPCVLPMIPILSSMIIGREKMSYAHSFLLSLFYVLGMAMTYAGIGVLFGYLGSNIQIVFQTPWIIFSFSALFVVMALSLFGLFQLQLPEKLRSKIANTSRHQKSGTYLGAAVMGILSTLILSPCVTPPLVAALGLISQSGNAFTGGFALFAMGFGMGAPLLLIGALGPKVLPKSGAWMNTIKNLMGFLMLAVAILMLQRVVPGVIAMLMWAMLCIASAIYLGALSTANGIAQLLKKTAGILIFVYGVLLMVSVYHGNTNPLNVFHIEKNQSSQPALHFQSVQTIDEIQQAVAAANASHKIVLLDFYADWCIACKEFDAFTLKNPQVQEQLKSYVLLRMDITKNTQAQRLVEQYYGVIAPPTLLFFKDNREIPGSRVIGFMPAKPFLAHLSKL